MDSSQTILAQKTAQIPCTLSGASARRLCLAKRWFSRHSTCFGLLCSLLGVNHQRATMIHPWQNACLHSSCHFSFEFEAILIFGKCVHQACGSTFWELAEIWTHLFREHHWISGWLIGQQVLSIKRVLMSQNCTTSYISVISFTSLHYLSFPVLTSL